MVLINPWKVAIVARNQQSSVRTATAIAGTMCYIESAMPRKRPTLAMAARAMRTSPRTLQRNLDQEGVGFKQLLERAESKRACELLRNPNLRVREISQSLGYRDPSSFSRAFRNWTGVSPRAYRQRPN
jgi:AraC-like DNA-binding protein